jgi:GT2 family glycosyltransferase
MRFVDMQDGAGSSQPLRASVIITTYNRCGALRETLDALGEQTLPPADYEVLVVDNGSSDGTGAWLAEFTPPYGLRSFRFEQNQGIGAARNRAIREAAGEALVLLSDDVLTPSHFLQTHLDTLQQFPGHWVVGHSAQLEALNQSPFGRFLNELEASFPQQWQTEEVAAGIWRTEWPTARNLALPRADLARIGLFDEQFHNACEDQDLAYRAFLELGTRFLYHAQMGCVHNDQAADLGRYCEAQRRGAADTVRFCQKYERWYAEHGPVPLMAANGPMSRGDSPSVLLRKAGKALLAVPPVRAALRLVTRLGERAGLPDPLLARLYRLAIAEAIYWGWRQGLRHAAGAEAVTAAQGAA